jgi:hypothetical protein
VCELKIHWLERVIYLFVIGTMGLMAILYTNRAIEENNAITCPLYSILDRPVAPGESPDVIKVREAIHTARIKYNCPPPLIKPSTTTTTRMP